MKLICAFGFAYADCWFSHEAAYFMFIVADGNNKNAKNYKELCKSLNKLADTDKEVLQNWLSKMIIVTKVGNQITCM